MSEVSDHYTLGNITETIKSGLRKTGRALDAVTVKDLSAVDEFHIGGHIASEHFFDRLGFRNGQKILDIGAGIGGGARYAAERFGVTVAGIDLTPDFIEAGRELNKWVGMESAVDLRVGDAAALEFPDESFDGAFSMHVFMNVPDKAAAFAEVFRVLKPGSVFGIYDVTRKGEGELLYPVPWAMDASSSFLARPDEYVAALEKAGFKVGAVEDRGEFAISYFEMVGQKMAAAGGPPPLGVHLMMGANAREKIANLTENLNKGLIAPFEMIAAK